MQMVSIDSKLYEDGIDAWFAAQFTSGGNWQHDIGEWSMNSPEQLLEEAQLRECLDKNIVSLQALQRSVFMLKDIEQIGLNDICNIMGLTNSNVRGLLHRARLKLLRVIDHYQETGSC